MGGSPGWAWPARLDWFMVFSSWGAWAPVSLPWQALSQTAASMASTRNGQRLAAFATVCPKWDDLSLMGPFHLKKQACSEVAIDY
jgi:hypothetical protein